VNDIRKRAEGIVHHSGIEEGFGHIRLEHHHVRAGSRAEC
jgi:hypothetical protein